MLRLNIHILSLVIVFLPGTTSEDLNKVTSDIVEYTTCTIDQNYHSAYSVTGSKTIIDGSTDFSRYQQKTNSGEREAQTISPNVSPDGDENNLHEATNNPKGRNKSKYNFLRSKSSTIAFVILGAFFVSPFLISLLHRLWCYCKQKLSQRNIVTSNNPRSSEQCEQNIEYSSISSRDSETVDENPSISWHSSEIIQHDLGTSSVSQQNIEMSQHDRASSSINRQNLEGDDESFETIRVWCPYYKESYDDSLDDAPSSIQRTDIIKNLSPLDTVSLDTTRNTDDTSQRLENLTLSSRSSESSFSC